MHIGQIQSQIFSIRGKQVMLDSDLAKIYGVSVKRFNEQVKRNTERFPIRYRFQLTNEEEQNLRSQIATSSFHGGRRCLPYVFTEQGVSILSAVLRSDTTIKLEFLVYFFNSPFGVIYTRDMKLYFSIVYRKYFFSFKKCFSNK